MEPTTTTATAATAATSMGLAALLAGAFGQVAADVMMVFLAAIAGTVIALSGGKSASPMQSLRFLFGATATALTLSWAIASLVSGLHPALGSAYTPTIISFLIGTQSMRLGEVPAKLGEIAAKLSGRIEKKIEE